MIEFGLLALCLPQLEAQFDRCADRAFFHQASLAFDSGTVAPHHDELKYGPISNVRRAGQCKTFGMKMGPPKEKHPFPFCIITRVYNYAEWIPEWLEYHHLLGVSKFIVLDDCSDDGGATHTIMEYYATLGFVDFYKNPPGYTCKNPREPDELKLFKIGWKMAKDAGCDWTGVLDVDEFIAFTGEWQTVDSIFTYLNNYPLPIVKMGWWLVGSDNQEHKSDGLQIENFITGDLAKTPHSKTIMRSIISNDWNNAHFSNSYDLPFECLSQIGETLGWQDDEIVEVTNSQGKRTHILANPILLKHYNARSYEEFLRGRGNLTLDSSGCPNQVYKNRAAWELAVHPGTFDPTATFTARMASRLRSVFATRKLPPVPHMADFLARPHSTD